MALIRRIARLVTADVHAVLDQIEEPEAVLKQAVREMEEELARQVQHGKWLAKEIEATGARIAALEKSRRDVDAKLDLAFANDNEELARKLTRRKVEIERLEGQLAAARARLEDERHGHEALVASNRDQLEGMRQKVALLCIEGAAAGAAHTAQEPFADIDETEVEIAFLREKQARAGA